MVNKRPTRDAELETCIPSATKKIGVLELADAKTLIEHSDFFENFSTHRKADTVGNTPSYHTPHHLSKPSTVFIYAIVVITFTDRGTNYIHIFIHSKPNKRFQPSIGKNDIVIKQNHPFRLSRHNSLIPSSGNSEIPGIVNYRNIGQIGQKFGGSIGRTVVNDYYIYLATID